MAPARRDLRHAARVIKSSVPTPLSYAVRRGLSHASASVAGASLALAAGILPATASADEIVYLEGFTVTTETSPAQAMFGEMSEEDQQDLCDPENASELQEQVTDMAFEVSEQLGSVDPGLQAAFNEALVPDVGIPVGPAINNACEGPDVTLQFVSMVYSTCRMTMRDGARAIDVRFPPGSGDGFLTFLDPATLQAIVMPYQSAGESPDSVNFARLMNQESGAVQGRDIGMGVGPPGNEEEHAIVINGRNVSLTGHHHTFNFIFDLNIARSMLGMSELFGGPGAADAGEAEIAQMEAMAAMMPTPRIRSSGTALIAPRAAGLNVIRTFYETFATAMGAEESYLSGLYNHEILKTGFPLRINQSTEMEMSVFGGLGGVMGLPGSSESTTEITRIVGPLSTDEDYCSQSIVPPNYTVSDPLSDAASAAESATSNAATAGSGGASSPAAVAPGAATAGTAGPAMPPSDEIAAAMAEVNEAFANMSEEDRAAMQQFAGNFGQLLGGALGGQGFPGAAAQGQSGAAGEAPAASAAPARAGTGQSSSTLMTGDLTQSVQNMLQALGYNPGNTDGEASIETTIAISQFQAEKGLEVTGEVTPQLVGILAAEVDSR